MRRNTDPRSPVQNSPGLGCLPFLIAAMAAFLFWGWRNSDTVTDWWDGEALSDNSGPARARANLVAIFSTDDYPMEAIRNEEQGTVAFRATVDRRGRVSSCEVTASSGSAALDEQTCRIIEERARFAPARDATGKRIEDSYSGRIRWELPTE